MIRRVNIRTIDRDLWELKRRDRKCVEPSLGAVHWICWLKNDDATYSHVNEIEYRRFYDAVLDKASTAM